MGIKLLILFLLPQSFGYLWIPELSVRTDLLSHLSAGIIPDTLTDIFLNPALASNIPKNRLYFSHQAPELEYPYSRIRCIMLTNFGFNIYMKTRAHFSIKEFTDLPEKKLGIAYAQKIGNQSFGIGYLHSYNSQYLCYGVPVDSERVQSISLGILSNELINGVVTFSKARYYYTYWPAIVKTIINTGVGVKRKVNNYLFFTYISLFDTSYHYDIVIFDRLGTPLVNTYNTKVYGIGQLEYFYAYMPSRSIIKRVKAVHQVIFRLGVSFEHLFDNFSILGNFSQHIGRCVQYIERRGTNWFTFFSDYPIGLGISIKTMPLELWIRTSPYILKPDCWNLEFSFIF